MDIDRYKLKYYIPGSSVRFRQQLYPFCKKCESCKTTESSDLGRAASRLELESETGILIDQQKAITYPEA